MASWLILNENIPNKKHDLNQELLLCDNMNGGGSGGGSGIGSEVILYPNPSKSSNQISFEGIDYKKIANIEVLNLSGVSKTNIKPVKQSFSVQNLKTGVYIIKFTTLTNEVIQKKLIIE